MNAAQLDLTYGPTGRIYQDPTGTDWTVELEIGGTVWLSGAGQLIRIASLALLATWRRIA